MKILLTGGNGNIANIIKKYLKNDYEITALSRDDLNILNLIDIKKYLDNNYFDILIHTAIEGGRRTISDNYNSFYNNMIMFENLMKFNNKFKMIINLDSGAIYNRETNILNRKENELFTIPTDFYGFSKYCIYQRTLLYSNIFNFRIFNIFHLNEENDRFIKLCFLSKNSNNNIIIQEDKYFDFFYEIDFIKIIKYYFDSINDLFKLEKTINISYKEKYKLSEIAEIIIKDKQKIVISNIGINNYSGNSDYLYKYNIKFLEMENSLYDYEQNLYYTQMVDGNFCRS